MKDYLRKLTAEIIARGHILSYDNRDFKKSHKAFFIKHAKTKQGILIEIGGIDESITPSYDILTVYLEDPWSLEIPPEALFAYNFPESLLAETLQVLYEFYRNKLYQLSKEKRAKLKEAYLKIGTTGYFREILKITKEG